MSRPCVICLAFLLSATLLLAHARAAADQPKAVVDATKLLEDALAKSKDEGEQEKLREAIEALKKIGTARKVQDELISDFLDNTAKYKGKTLTFKATYYGGPAKTTLRDSVGVTGKFLPIFTAIDPKNEAKLNFAVEIPAGLTVPAAVKGDELIVTFKCNNGDNAKGNTAVEIRRP